MIKSLNNLKEYVDHLSDKNITEPDWNFINKFLKAFKPLWDCTNKFQFEQYLVGDFYRDW
ncbi:hypothetical protein CVS40_3302 [Lucilia cuprina]|nr:hypothetical protein CVS40_3302 [Lucilia cuprina]